MKVVEFIATVSLFVLYCMYVALRVSSRVAESNRVHIYEYRHVYIVHPIISFIQSCHYHAFVSIYPSISRSPSLAAPVFRH